MKTPLLILSLALSACLAPVSPSPQPELLPPLPTQAVSQLGPVPVVFVDSLTNGDGHSVAGGFHSIRRTIYLRRDLLKQPVSAWAVYFHEVCHVWLYDSGVYNLLPYEVQQTICDAQAAYRVAELLDARRRP